MTTGLVVDLATGRTRTVRVPAAEMKRRGDRAAAAADRVGSVAAALASATLPPAVAEKLAVGAALTKPESDAVLRWLALRVAAHELIP